MVKVDKILTQIIPNFCKFKDKFIEIIPDLMEYNNIKTINHISHFLSQIMHESCDLTILEEDLNYTSIDRLRAIFPKVFQKYSNEVIKLQFCSNPEMIGNLIYANKNGNGDQKSGDGSLYRGRGIIQLTGRNNYTKASYDLYGDDTLIKNPELVSTNLNIACQTAFWWWNNNINRLKEFIELDSEWAIIGATRIINGGQNGLEDRKIRFYRYQLLLQNNV